MSALTSQTRSIPTRREQIDRDSWVSIRPIERTDAAALSDFYRGLAPRSTRQRFLSAVQPTPEQLDRLAAADGLVGILVERGPRDGAIVAHASLHVDGAGGAEVAFAVADELQGQGIGSRLFAATVAHARRIGLRRLSAILAADNGRMRRLLARADCPVITDEIEGGSEEVVLDLAAAA
jgi:GNAT superfamily N-acetyltransferase